MNEYDPARDPGGDRPGGSRVRFEQDAAGNEQSMFGGSAADIERSILEDTAVNQEIIGLRIMGVRTVKKDLGAGELGEVELKLCGIRGPDKMLRFVWTDQGLVMAVRGS